MNCSTDAASVIEHDEMHCGRIAVARFSIADARTRFSELIQKAMAGEEVIITKDNKPVVKLVPIVSPAKKRIPGFAEGQYGWHGILTRPRGFQGWDVDVITRILSGSAVSDRQSPRSARSGHRASFRSRFTGETSDEAWLAKMRTAIGL